MQSQIRLRPEMQVPGVTWQRTTAIEAGFDPDALAEAVAFAQAHESTMNRDIAEALSGGHFSEPLPDGEIIGPVKPRGDPSGVIIRGGRIVSQWGPVDAPDMTFSVTKSYLALVAGIAVADRLFDIDDRPGDQLPDLFEPPHNSKITWRQLLTNTSEWQGELWGKADRIDRNRSLATLPGAPSLKGTHRDLQEPGTFWEYNDVRVNVLSYALMQVLRRPLPDVLRSRIMRPIGASDTWEWHGYDNSWVDLNGDRMQSVSGGAHWGGGMMISTMDHARIGLLMARIGRWGEQELLPADWVRACATPCPLNPSYGLMWWLNGNRAQYPSAPNTSFFAIGVGSNVIWVDPGLDLVVVVRWIDKPMFDGFAKALVAALK